MASYVNLVCARHAEYLHLLCMVHGVDRVFMAGGFCNNPTVRRAISRFWLARNVLFGQVSIA